MRTKLTQPQVDRLRPPAGGKAQTHWDSALVGFAVRVSPQGRKTFLAQYRVPGLGKEGKPLEVVQTFGTADKLTLAEAQKQAKAAFALAREGVNPVQARKQKLAATQVSAAEKVFTFEVMAERYMNEYVALNNRVTTAREIRRLLTRAARLPHDDKRTFGELPAKAITRDDVEALMATSRAGRAATKPGQTNGLVETNSLLSALHRCFRWTREQRLIPGNPALDIPKPLRKIATRDRVLEDDELVAFWSGCEQIGWPFGPLFKLLLLTAQRLNEVADMRWTELDLDKGKWLIPAARTKNGRQHEVALSELATEILQALPHLETDFVFASERGDGQVTGFAYAKALVAAHMGISDWRLHDLRRTATTGMARLGVPPHIADKVLNHQSGSISGVAAVYNRFSYLDERRDALSVWGGFVERLVYPERVQTNVVAIAGR